MTACPLCGGRGRPAFEKAGWRHAECDRCATWYVDPVPSADALAAFYRDASADPGSRFCWEGTARHAHATWARALADAERLAGRGPLLDVGCGGGQFLEFARERGWVELEGVELSEAAAAAARARTGARIHPLPLDDAPLEEGRWAAITAWDVLEHLRDPGRALRRAFALLRPGGVLAVGTPHRHGLTLRTFRARALLVMPPEHLLLASRAGLRAAAAAAGFEVMRLETVDLHLRQWTAWMRGGGAVAPPGGAAPDRPAARDRAAFLATYRRLTGASGFGALQATANLALRAARLGDQLVAVLRRPARRC